jgi:hypothetical protein
MDVSKIFSSLKGNKQLSGFLQGMGSSQGGVLDRLAGGAAGAVKKKMIDDTDTPMIPDTTKRKRAILGAINAMGDRSIES